MDHVWGFTTVTPNGLLFLCLRLDRCSTVARFLLQHCSQQWPFGPCTLVEVVGVLVVNNDTAFDRSGAGFSTALVRDLFFRGYFARCCDYPPRDLEKDLNVTLEWPEHVEIKRTIAINISVSICLWSLI